MQNSFAEIFFKEESLNIYSSTTEKCSDLFTSEKEFLTKNTTGILFNLNHLKASFVLYIPYTQSEELKNITELTVKTNYSLAVNLPPLFNSVYTTIQGGTLSVSSVLTKLKNPVTQSFSPLQGITENSGGIKSNLSYTSYNSQLPSVYAAIKNKTDSVFQISSIIYSNKNRILCINKTFKDIIFPQINISLAQCLYNSSKEHSSSSWFYDYKAVPPLGLYSWEAELNIYGKQLKDFNSFALYQSPFGGFFCFYKKQLSLTSSFLTLNTLLYTASKDLITCTLYEPETYFQTIINPQVIFPLYDVLVKAGYVFEDDFCAKRSYDAAEYNKYINKAELIFFYKNITDTISFSSVENTQEAQLKINAKESFSYKAKFFTSLTSIGLTKTEDKINLTASQNITVKKGFFKSIRTADTLIIKDNQINSNSIQTSLCFGTTKKLLTTKFNISFNINY